MDLAAIYLICDWSISFFGHLGWVGGKFLDLWLVGQLLMAAALLRSSWVVWRQISGSVVGGSAFDGGISVVVSLGGEGRRGV